MKKKIYIAGPITGMEEQARENFTHAAIKLSMKGYEVVNPFNLEHHHDKSWKSYMKVCIPALLECDMIYLLEGWEFSEGASLEFQIADKLKIQITTQEHGKLIE